VPAPVSPAIADHNSTNGDNGCVGADDSTTAPAASDARPADAPAQDSPPPSAGEAPARASDPGGARSFVPVDVEAPVAETIQGDAATGDCPIAVPAFSVTGSPGATKSDSLEPSVVPTAATAPAESEGTKHSPDSEWVTSKKAFDKIVLELARIIFAGEELTDVKIRLVRIALERYTIQQILNGTAGAA
jgi:hypothetical protein